MESKPKVMPPRPHEDTEHRETRATGKTTLSPHEAIQGVIEKYKSANESIPPNLLTKLSYLKVKDPYSEFERTKLTVVGHSAPSVTQSKSTKASSAPVTSQSKSIKGCSPPSASQPKTSKGISPPSEPQSKTSKGMSPPSALQSHVVTPSAPLHKPKEKSYTPRLAFSSGLFSPDAAEKNRIIVDLPNSDSSRENYILNEYDCRMKKHIAFQAATFEVLNVQKGLNEVSNLIQQQRKFEEKWPSRYSETTPSEGFYDENIFNIDDEVREINMTEMLKESQEIINLLQILLNNVDTAKHS